MRRLSLLMLALGLFVFPLAGHAQEPELPPLVLFVEDEQLATASIQDSGPDGLTELEQIFTNLGARTTWAYVDDPIPEETRIVVLVRPLRPMTVDQVARLWVHIARGGSLLLASDPAGPITYWGNGTVDSNTDRSAAGLPVLLSLVFGINLQDTFVTEPWFTATSIAESRTAHSIAYVEDIVRHPVTDHLSAYGLPVQLWGARSMRVEPIGPHSYAIPLLYTLVPYGETNRGVFDGSVPLELNLGPDSVGRLLIGALAENTLTGSRVVVLGDSEIVQNEYGLVTRRGSNNPVHIADRVLTERLAAWLLDRPFEEWATLPAGYTWLALDGQSNDWPAGSDILEDELNDTLVPRYDLERLYAFRDDRYLYVQVKLTEPPNPDVRVSLGLENTFDGVVDFTIAITPGETVLLRDREEPVPIVDGAMIVGAIIEIRLPLRVVGDGTLIGDMCLTGGETPLDSPPIDCVKQMPTMIPVSNTQAPVDTWVSGPRVIVETSETGVNVRAGPGSDARAIELVANGAVFAATGRTALGDWVQVENAGYTGWLAAFLVNLNTDIGALPIVTP